MNPVGGALAANRTLEFVVPIMPFIARPAVSCALAGAPLVVFVARLAASGTLATIPPMEAKNALHVQINSFPISGVLCVSAVNASYGFSTILPNI